MTNYSAASAIQLSQQPDIQRGQMGEWDKRTLKQGHRPIGRQRKELDTGRYVPTFTNGRVRQADIETEKRRQAARCFLPPPAIGNFQSSGSLHHLIQVCNSPPCHRHKYHQIFQISCSKSDLCNDDFYPALSWGSWWLRIGQECFF